MRPGPHWILRCLRDVPADDTWLSPRELDVQSGLHIIPRRNDWRLGRWAAKQALSRHLGIQGLARIAVLAASDGAPQAYLDDTPLPWVLSLSHCDNEAIAVLCASPVGGDIEAIRPRADSFGPDYLTKEENHAVAGLNDPDLGITLCWSIKESALKLRRTGLRRHTQSVQVELPTMQRSRRWQAVQLLDLDSPGPLFGWWRILGTKVLTIVTSEPGPEPAALDSATSAC
jgi:4'-phosphopantetheinyl transferase EntD